MVGVLAPLTGKTLYKNDQVYGVLDTVSNWFHLDRVSRATGAIEVFEGWASAVGWNTPTPTYMIVNPLTPPPPPSVSATLDITVTDPVTGKRYGKTGIELPEV